MLTQRALPRAQYFFQTIWIWTREMIIIRSSDLYMRLSQKFWWVVTSASWLKRVTCNINFFKLVWLGISIIYFFIWIMPYFDYKSFFLFRLYGNTHFHCYNTMSQYVKSSKYEWFVLLHWTLTRKRLNSDKSLPFSFFLGFREISKGLSSTINLIFILAFLFLAVFSKIASFLFKREYFSFILWIFFVMSGWGSLCELKLRYVSPTGDYVFRWMKES